MPVSSVETVEKVKYGPMEMVFPARAEVLSDVRAFVAEAAARVGAGEDEVRELVLAVSEACANAVIHANGTRIRVEISFTSGRLMISVRDEGRFLSGARPRSGYGIPIMVSLTDELVITGGSPERPGTEVRLVKRLDTDPVKGRAFLNGRDRGWIEH